MNMSGESAMNAQAKDWQSSKHIRKRARYLLDHPDEEIPSDVTFLVGDGKNEPQKTFKCHKFLLAMVSSMFQAMFFGLFPQTDGPIKIPDVTPTAFQYMLRYAYGEDIKCNDFKGTTDALDALYCAKKYLIGKLARTCRDSIQFHLVVLKRDPCEVFERAPQMDEEDLATLALARIARSRRMRGAAFLCLSFGSLQKIVDCTYLAAKETDLYQDVRGWVMHNGGMAAGRTLKEAFGSLLYSIRFPLFGATELSDGPVADGVLTDAEAIGVFRFLLSKIKPTVPFLTTPRIPVATPMEYSVWLMTAPATVLPGGITNHLKLYTRPDLAPECCAFLRQLRRRDMKVWKRTQRPRRLGEDFAPFPTALADERSVLSHTVKGACWFEWDIEEGAMCRVRIGAGRKPHRYHSAVFGFVFCSGNVDNGLWVPFDLWDDKCIQGVSASRT